MERAELKSLVRATGCAEERGEFVFLCDRGWTALERRQAEELMQSAKGKGMDADTGWLGVRTGGSGGGMKFARHDERTISAAVGGFCVHFSLPVVNAVDVLPAHHVSGLMSRARCAATGGEHVAWSWKRLESGEFPELAGARPWVVSLVPTQLQRLMGAGQAGIREGGAPGARSGREIDWLRRFEIIFLGGGPVWPELAETARRLKLPISLTYGMTETAAMVAASRPLGFLTGDSSCGGALPHAEVDVNGEGRVVVSGDSVFRGYFPERRDGRIFETEDLGRIDERGHLHVLGRRDAVIITGGKKVQPSEVEAVLRASGEFDDVVVIGLPDAEWGEAVVACYPGGGRAPDPARVAAALASLAPHQHPKRYVPVTPWPRTAQGKVNRGELRKAAGRG